jgi:hypothetical protein
MWRCVTNRITRNNGPWSSRSHVRGENGNSGMANEGIQTRIWNVASFVFREMPLELLKQSVIVLNGCLVEPGGEAYRAE